MNTPPPPSPMPSPWLYRWRYWRRRALPLTVWLGAVLALVVLSRGQSRQIRAVGLVQSPEVAVAPLEDGTVQEIGVRLFDEVEAGQIVALMDDGLLRAQIKTAQAELLRLSADIQAEEERIRLDLSEHERSGRDDRRRFVLNEEQARIDYLDRLVQQQSDQVKLDRLALELKRQETLLADGITDQASYDDIRLRHEALQTRIEQNATALTAAQMTLREATARRKTYDRETPGIGVDVERLLGSLRAAVKVQEARIGEFGERRRHLTLHAPLTGKVFRVSRRVGETVMAGDPLLAIASPRADTVVAYVDAPAADYIRVGQPVQLASHRQPKEFVEGRVLKLGARMEPYPAALTPSFLGRARGFSVLIGRLPTHTFRPGETLNLCIDTR